MRSRHTQTEFQNRFCTAVAAATVLASAATWAADVQAPTQPAPSHHLPGVTDKDGDTRRLTQENLQRELFQFVDRYRELIEQVSDEGAGRAKTPNIRMWFQGTKTTYVSAAVSVVTGPRPIDALRDLMVMVSLQRIVWSSDVGGKMPHADAEPVARALGVLETEIYDLASRVVPTAAIATLRKLIEQWRRENPKQNYVAFVRFQNLGSSPGATEINEVVASGGFLAPVESVAREAHEARLLAERTLYLANRMPMLIEWQASLAYQRITASPEAAGMLDNLNGYRAVLEKFSQDFHELPGKVTEERRGLMADVSQLVAKERAETMRNVRTLVRGEREALFRDLSKGADTYGPILGQLSVTAAATRDAVAGLERMTAASRSKNRDEGKDLKRFQVISERLAAAASDTNSVVVGLNSLVNAEMRGLASIDVMLASQVQRVFLYSVALVLLIGAVAYAVLGAARRHT